MELPVRVADFQNVVFFTGAGMSAESGVPTYRGRGGIWHEYDYEEYACQSAFDRDPRKVWEFHNIRRERVARCTPHAGHEGIVRCEKHGPATTVVTQNIDGMHQLAGSQKVFELHGSLWRVRCNRCDTRHSGREAPFPDISCPQCSGYWRPDIVWFGDHLDPAVVASAMAAIRACDLLVAIGTSAVVFPAAAFPLEAKRAGATLIEINLEKTAMSDAYDYCMLGPASEILTALCTGIGA